MLARDLAHSSALPLAAVVPLAIADAVKMRLQGLLQVPQPEQVSAFYKDKTLKLISSIGVCEGVDTVFWANPNIEKYISHRV